MSYNDHLHNKITNDRSVYINLFSISHLQLTLIVYKQFYFLYTNWKHKNGTK